MAARPLRAHGAGRRLDVPPNGISLERSGEVRVIKIEQPPNFERIHAVFPNAGDKGVLVAYGEDIFNPSNVHISPALLAHEYRHCARQWQADPEAWWEKYMTDQEFRYHEELIAHAEEYACQAKMTKDRNAR